MTTSELVLEWAKLLLQWQVLAAVFLSIGAITWRREISKILSAFADRGGKFSAGPVSGELSATVGDADPPKEINDDLKASPSKSDDEQKSSLLVLANQFRAIMRAGPGSRSEFVHSLRTKHYSGWSWPFLKQSLRDRRMPARFCAASLLTSVIEDLSPNEIAFHITQESSSLVRYRLLEALTFWCKAGTDTNLFFSESLAILRSHIEENLYVREQLNIVIRMLEQKYL